jgi:cation diffusion facilitator CzcD-associated flavoprotein CzcO
VLSTTGYINHDKAHVPKFKDAELFEGEVLHTQFWKDIDYNGKNVVVIGSGATAFSIVPELAKQSSVTMIQRSPTYMRTESSEPTWLTDIKQSSDPIDVHARAREYSKNFQYESVNRCVDRPQAMKRILIKDVQRKLNADIDIKHFTPNYSPWEQRLCTLIDDDFINAVNNGVSIETDNIDRFTKNSIILSSGKEILADVIVYATGFETQMNGSMKIVVNSQEKKFGKQLVYKGVMIEGLPNFGFIFGYTKMSWTLKLDLALQYCVRVLNFMIENNYNSCTPVNKLNIVGTSGFLDLQTNFYLRNESMFPRVATLPWTNNNDIVADKITLLDNNVDDGILKFV